MSDPLAAPALQRVADLSVQVGAPIEVGAVGHGTRRVIPILGGTCTARDWTAKVLTGGADFQLIVNERMARLEARYVLETDAGDRIYVHNDAVRTAAPEVMARLVRGEPVDPANVYFRCAPRAPAGACVDSTSRSSIAHRLDAVVIWIALHMRPANRWL